MRSRRPIVKSAPLRAKRSKRLPWSAIRKLTVFSAAASRLAVGNHYVIYEIRKGREPKFETVRSVCEALGLEFYIGLPRGDQDGASAQASEPPPADAGVPAASAALDPAAFATDVKEAVRDQMASILKVEAQAIRQEVCEGINEHLHALQDETIPRLTPPANDLEDARALAVATVGDGATDVSASRSVQMIEIEAAAGGGAYNLDDAPAKGPVWFGRGWIDSHGIDPTQAVIISVRGDSMEPTLPAGCKILMDRQRRRRHVGHIYVITTPEGLIVKRLGRGEDGGWLLVSDSDSSDWPDVSWPDDAVVAGEVKWMARGLP